MIFLVWIKICGITNTMDLDAASKAGADALGFIVDVSLQSPRKITAKVAKELIAEVKGRTDTVVVATPANAMEANKLVELLQPDYLQIHSDLEVGEIKKVKNHVKIIKTVEVTGFNALKKLEQYEAHVDAILLDSAKKGEKGVLHDWEISAEITRESSVPVILAGGLNPENVAAAISTVNPFGVDVASGVESKPGRKDTEKIRKFIERARQHGNF